MLPKGWVSQELRVVQFFSVSPGFPHRALPFPGGGGGGVSRHRREWNDALTHNVIVNKIYVNVMSTLCQRYVNVMSTLCQRYVNVMSTLCQRYVNVMSTLCQRYVNVMSTLCQRYVNVHGCLKCCIHIYGDVGCKHKTRKYLSLRGLLIVLKSR